MFAEFAETSGKQIPKTTTKRPQIATKNATKGQKRLVFGK
jgi:hypothetical protein